jgi:hypothetical protein
VLKFFFSMITSLVQAYRKILFLLHAGLIPRRVRAYLLPKHACHNISGATGIPPQAGKAKRPWLDVEYFIIILM